MIELLFIYTTGALSLILLVLAGIRIGSRTGNSEQQKQSIDNLQFISVMAAVLIFFCFSFLLYDKILILLILGVFLFVMALVIPKNIQKNIRQKKVLQLKAQLPAGLDMLSNSLRAGLTLQQAVQRNISRFPAQLSEEFTLVLQDISLGCSMSQAMENFGDRLNDSDAKMIATASRISLSHGGNLAESYATLAALMRDKETFETELRALTSEGRMQAVVMTLLPFVLMALMFLIQTESMLAFLADPVGIGLVLLLVIMQTGAYFWIRAIMDIKI